MTVDATAEARVCPVSILYLRAAADKVVRARCADEIRAVVPSMEIVELAGPHLALVTDPAASWAALTAFMARTGAGTG